MLGQIALKLDSNREAVTIFRRTLDLVPGFAPLRFELATALMMQGEVEESLKEVDALLREAPRDANYLSLKAVVLAKIGNFAAAAAIYEALIPRHGDNRKLWVLYGNILRTLRRRDDTIAAFRRAIAIAPDYGEPWWHLANLKIGALTVVPRDVV